MTDLIKLRGVNKYYGTYHALRDIDLTIRAGEFFSLLGPSGCGKTTLLRVIAGFEGVSDGTVMISDRDMANVPPNQRPTNMVFQSYAIFPHLTVAENVAFGLRKRSDIAKSARAGLVEEALEMVGLGGYGKRAAHALSGGQRQRVALARALILKPKVLLLDEPLSALDKKMREHMQVELIRLQRHVGITFILVTHDQEEALVMSDRIAVMFAGEIGQMDDPETLYRRPKSRRVAEFIGKMNFLPGQVTALSAAGEASSGAPLAGHAPGTVPPNRTNRLLTDLMDKIAPGTEANADTDTAEEAAASPEVMTVDIAGLGAAQISVDQAPEGAKLGEVAVGIRPETLAILFEGEMPKRHECPGVVDEVVYYGDMTYYDVRIKDVPQPLTIAMKNLIGRPVLEVGAACRVAWDDRALVLF
ncbi:ABC transporter ATP-binding protein [Loktanella sp. TSTF-M6]|uniref:ABC transporter ATP-binding protein n=1 Tax=Loktanella gaetbuli TaxID=2881335 RepID=A0ABS8BQH1_9RHOB|nr:ABC transporter ATP-binding protein [Loktanella gaetbuli]MCB5197968.1 ABC transporter ATP-binding protein [Loktanella gaetbuli]